jgi:hypothetical protein
LDRQPHSLSKYYKNSLGPGVVVVASVAHAFNSSTQEVEAGGFLSLRPAWSTKCVPGQPGLYRETLSRKKKKKLHLAGNSLVPSSCKVNEATPTCPRPPSKRELMDLGGHWTSLSVLLCSVDCWIICFSSSLVS